MAKFDGIRMQDLVEVQDPDKDGGITLVFKDDKFLHIKIVDGKLVTESVHSYRLRDFSNRKIISSCGYD